MANKLITLKELYPKADVFTIAASRPRTLMQSEQAIKDNAAKVGGWGGGRGRGRGGGGAGGWALGWAGLKSRAGRRYGEFQGVR